MLNATCANCIFWCQPEGWDNYAYEEIAECRRHSPRQTKGIVGMITECEDQKAYRVWPHTSDDDFCGDWQGPRNQPAKSEDQDGRQDG